MKAQLKTVNNVSKLRRIIYFCVFLIFSTPLHGNPKIERLLKTKGINPKQTSILAISYPSGKRIYEYHPNRLLNPASNVKLATAFCSLKELGANHRFTTSYYSEVPPQNGTIGTLWIKGGADASLVSETLWKHVAHLKGSGIKHISGPIVLDSTIFENGSHPGRQENNLRAYNAPSSGLSLNYNSLALYIHSNNRDPKPFVSSFPEIPNYIQIQNRLVIGNKKKINILLSSHEGKEIVSLNGSLPRTQKPTIQYRTILNPNNFFAHAFKQLLKEAGISEQSPILLGSTPENAHLLWEAKSKPLSLIVRGMMKYSNNFMAESLIKYLGHHQTGRPGSSKLGMQVIENCLLEIGIPKGGYQLQNGSGLHPENLMSSAQLVRILIAAHNNPKLNFEFVNALSTYGTDGTMHDRDYGKSLIDTLRGKTGHLTGVSSLTGFLPLENNNKIVFAILMNGLKTNRYEAQKIQDEILEVLRDE